MKKSFLLLAASVGVVFVTGCTPPSNFDLADENGDGHLSKDEAEKALLTAIFGNGDPDGDGRLSFEEVRMADPKYPRSRFDARDLDGDQFVSPEELDRFADQTDSFGALIESMDTDGNGYVDRGEAEDFNQRLAATEGDNPLQKLINLNASLGGK